MKCPDGFRFPLMALTATGSGQSAALTGVVSGRLSIIPEGLSGHCERSACDPPQLLALRSLGSRVPLAFLLEPEG